jgi:hypothetical protein
MIFNVVGSPNYNTQIHEQVGRDPLQMGCSANRRVINMNNDTSQHVLM